jgi:hypothetical protein
MPSGLGHAAPGVIHYYRKYYRKLFPIALAAGILLFAVERPGTGGPRTLN